MKKTFIIILIVLLILFSSGGFFIYYETYVPVAKDEDIVSVEIKKDDSTSDIAKELKSKGIIRNQTIFTYYSLLTHQNILPGIYYLSPDMKISEILDILGEGKVAEIRVTIPEGWRREQIAQKLEDEGVIDAASFLAASEGLEGYLFPDTYQFGIKNTAEEVVNKFTTNFYAQTAGLDVTYDDLILASIIEREAKRNEDRAGIASVYANRLDIGMKLDADPTIQYAKGTWDTLSSSDFQLDTPYNTYIYSGLPPTPICNPGLESIKAAVSPASSDNYYFINLRDGTTIFSQTLTEHEANIEQYRDQM